MTTAPPVTDAGSVAVVDVSVVVTGHHEGAQCQPTFAALARAIEAAGEAGISVEVVGVLDRADAATAASFASAVGQDGVVGRLAPARTLVTDHGDPGMARNDGIRHARAPWVCVLDGDNLPSRSWLRDAFRAAQGHGAPCVVHPEQLVIFGDRWQVWPQLASDHPGFRAHNFFDRTYWDTFCLASREVFRTLPYARTQAARGLGPEDWHWGMETVHAGIAHLTAPGTALLYRSKPTGSVQRGHDAARSLLPPTPLLLDRDLAATADGPAAPARPRRRGLQRAIVRASRGRESPAPPPAPARGRWARRRVRPAGEPAASTGPEFDPLHYRALNAAALRMSDDQATAHYRDTGRASGWRALLTAAELRDVAALDLDDYQALHPDLADLDDDALLHHYLAHGRAEGRAARMTSEQREARRPVSLDPEMIAELHALHALEPAIPEPTRAELAALVHVGPPSDGSLTRGSRAWWQAIAALGPQRPDAIVFVSHVGPDDPGPDAHRPSGWSDVGLGRRVVVVATHEPSPRPSWLDDRVLLIDLPGITEWHELAQDERHRLVATLVVQLRPGVVHVLDSPEFSAALADYGPALRASTHLDVPGDDAR